MIGQGKLAFQFDPIHGRRPSFPMADRRVLRIVVWIPPLVTFTIPTPGRNRSKASRLISQHSWYLSVPFSFTTDPKMR
jgi:hypothetical protein